MTLNLVNLWMVPMVSIMRILEVIVFMWLLITIYIDVDLVIAM